MSNARLALLLAGYFGVLLGGVLALQDPAIARRLTAGTQLPSGLTPNGTDLEAPTTGQTGAAAGCNTTVYGQFCFGDIVEPNFRGGGPQFYEVMLNGTPAEPGFNVMYAQRMFVGCSGNSYASFIGDELIGGWQNNTWVGDNGQTGPDGFPGAGGNQVPVCVPTPQTLPGFVWAGPYTPSTDGTTISGGIGTVVTRDGFWTFGAPGGGGGYALMLNGIPVGNTSPPPYQVIALQVNAQGNLFAQMTDSTWQVYASHEFYNCTGTTAGPIPIRMRFLDNFGVPNGGLTLALDSPMGTFISNVTIQMSDGSGFTGTYAVEDEFGMHPIAFSGSTNKLVTNVSSWPGSSFNFVTTTQNGCAYFSKIHIFAM